MAKLKDIIIGVIPKINAEKAEAEAKKFTDKVKSGLGGIKNMVGKAHAGGQKMLKSGAAGIAILDAIQGRLSKTLDTVNALTGTAGQIADLAYSIGTTEERLVGVELAFANAGVGSKQMLHTALGKFQEKVVDGSIDIGNRDTLTGFLDYMQWLSTMGADERNQILEEDGFGKRNFEMSKLIGGMQNGVLNQLNNQELVGFSRSIGDGVRAGAGAGDQMEGDANRAEYAQIALYNERKAFQDAIAAQQRQHAIELAKAGSYTQGQMEEGVKFQATIDVIMNTIPNLLATIASALTTTVEGSFTNPAWMQRLDLLLTGIGNNIGSAVEQVKAISASSTNPNLITEGDI